MNDFLTFLSNNPVIMWLLAIAFFLLIITVIGIFIAAYVAGREISIYPPKIGKKNDEFTESNTSNEKKVTDSIQEEDFSIQEGDFVSAPITFFVDKPSLFREYLEEANTILMLGIVMFNTTRRYYSLFKNKLERGSTIKTLIADPERINLHEIIHRFSPPQTPVEGTKTNFKSVFNWYDELQKVNPNSSSVEMRLMGFIPPFSLYIFPDSTQEFVLVELYGYQTGKSSIPRFIINNKDNPYWYAYFMQQFWSIWENSNEPG